MLFEHAFCKASVASFRVEKVQNKGVSENIFNFDDVIESPPTTKLCRRVSCTGLGTFSNIAIREQFVVGKFRKSERDNLALSAYNLV